jgi:pimeloyl-ACP methyl ester carboxylesterase
MPGKRKTRTVFLGVSLPAAGLAGAVWIRYQGEIRRERKRVSTGSQIAETPRGPIEYASVGFGPPVLLVHGAGGGYDQGLLLGQPLAAKGFHVFAMSRFGYLGTPLPGDASAAAQADAHASLLDTLGIERAAIVGVSAGAPSAMQFALRHADRTSALALLVPLAYAPRANDALPRRIPPGTRSILESALNRDFLFWAAIRLAPSVAIRAILGTPPDVVRKAGAAEKARVAEFLKLILPVTSRRAGLLNDAAIATALPRYELEKIAVPTLAISVKDDLYGTYEGARYTAKNVPGARFKGYRSGGHLLVGHNAEALAEIAAFIKEHQPSAEVAPTALTTGAPISAALNNPSLPS